MRSWVWSSDLRAGASHTGRPGDFDVASLGGSRCWFGFSDGDGRRPIREAVVMEVALVVLTAALGLITFSILTMVKRLSLLEDAVADLEAEVWGRQEVVVRWAKDEGWKDGCG